MRNWFKILGLLAAVAALAGMAFTGVRRNVKIVRRDTTAAPAGVVVIDWQRHLMKGEQLVVKGRWMGTKARLLLMGMGEVLDSAVCSDAFSLKAVPAQAGRAVYSLVAIAGGDTVEREDIPVEVRAGRPLRVLLLAASPDFEHTFLVNWLSAEGDGVASRTMVSRDRYQTSFANMPERSLDVLTPALLEEFDLVIADSGALSPVVSRRVRELGIGLYIRKDGEKTYVDWMKGAHSAYAGHWTKILRQVARVKDTAEEWSWQPVLPRIGYQMKVMVETGVSMPEGFFDGDVVYLEQDAGLSFRWRGNYWPRHAGWTAIRTSEDTTWGYVWPADAWKGIYPGETETIRRPMAGYAGMPKTWCFVIFLGALFFLWIEGKMSEWKV